MQNNKAVYVGIENFIPIRREILTSSICFIKFLERYEKLKEIRVNKENEILYLKNLLKDIRNSLAEYKNSLPWIEGKEEKHKKKVKIGKKKEFKLKIKKIKQKKTMTESDKLNKELNIIKEKLASIEGF